MSAMTPVRTPIVIAYGKPMTSIPTKQREPMIRASVTWAVMKRENAVKLICAACSRYERVGAFRMSESTFLICLWSLSLFDMK